VRIFLIMAMLLSAFSAQAATRFALLIGNNVGGIEDGALRWAEEDARRVRDVFQELGDVAQGRALLLLGVDVDQMRSALARLRGQVEEAKRQGYRSEVFIFYSGHGDASSLHFGSQRFDLQEFKRLIQAIPADTSVTIIDACRSRALKSGRGKGARHGPAFDISLPREPGPVGRVVITSAGANEIAQETDEYKSSFFTHHMLSALRGAADADSDGRVTLAEFYRYVYHHTLASSHGVTAAVQHPEMEVKLEGEGEIAMTNLERSGSTLVLPRGIGGDFLLVDDRNGRVIAEVRKPEKESRSLALPTGRYRVQLRSGGRIFAGEVALEWGGRRKLDASVLQEQPLVAALTKGSQLDPASWAFSSAGLVGTPLVLADVVAAGAALGTEHHVSGWPVFLVSSLQITHAEAKNPAWRYKHLESRLAFGVGYGLFMGPVRLSATLTAGVLFLYERAYRLESERVGPVIGAPTREDGLVAGPCVSPGLALRVPVADAWALLLGAEMQLAVIPVDGTWDAATAVLGRIGVEYEF
jgi:hypothetical protein